MIAEPSGTAPPQQPLGVAPSASGRFDPRDWRIAAAVFLVALLVRGVYLYQAADSPTFQAPVVDAMTYHFLAVKLAGPRHLLDYGYFWQPFFYPFMLAVIYLFSGTSILTAKIVNILLGSGTCVLTYVLGRKIFDRRVGLLAAGFAIFYGPMIFWEADLMSDWLAGFWSMVLLLLFLRAKETRGIWTCFAIGLCGVLGILTRPTVLPFFLVGCAYLAWSFYRSAERWRLVIAAFRNGLGGFLLVALPVMALNYYVTKEIALLPSSGGINLYIGNNPDLCRTLTIRPGYEWEEFTAMPYQEGSTEDTPAKQQAFFYRKVWEYMLHQPLSFLSGLGAKTLRFLSSRELPRNIDIYMFRQWSTLLAALVWKAEGFGFPFGVLLPLTVVGMVLRWRAIPVFLWLFLVLYPVAVILVFIAGRYRLPVIPAMTVVAAAGVFGLVDLWRRRRRLIVGVLIACMVAVAVVSSLPGPFCEEEVNFTAELPYVLGAAYFEYGRGTGDRSYYEKAAASFAEATRLKNDYADAYNNLGNCRALQGRLEEALSCYQRAVELNPKLAQGWTNIGMIQRKLGRQEEALAALQRAIAIKDSLGLAHYHMAVTLLKAGRGHEIQEHLAKAARLDPDKAHRLWAKSMLADALAAGGQTAQAIADYRQVLREAAQASPAAKARALKGAAWLLATSPDSSVRNGQEAVRLVELAARIDGDSPSTQDILAAAYAETGEFDEATAAAGKALAAAERAGNVEMAMDIRARLQLYQAGQPCRRAGPYPFFPLP